MRRRATIVLRASRVRSRHPQLLVDADDEVPDDRVGHAQAAIDFLHQLARAGDGLDDVGALAVVADLVGQLLRPQFSVLSKVPLKRWTICSICVCRSATVLLGRVRRDDVDELVLSCADS